MAKNKLSLADLSRQRKKVLEEIDESPPTSNFTENVDEAVVNGKGSVEEAVGDLAMPLSDVPFRAGLSAQIGTTESTLTVNRDPNLNHSPVEIEVSEETKRPGRPKSLRSDPNYETTTIFLHRGTKAKARYHLATQEQKQDLQVLLNELLEDWVTKREQNSANI